MAPVPYQGSLRTISRPNSSPSRGHIIGAPCEAARLLSLDPSHRTSPEPERDATAIVEDGHETGICSSPAPSNQNNVGGTKDMPPVSPCRATHWKTIWMITGFLFAGLLSALGHYLLVRNLDGTLTDTSYLTQSQASAISVLFTTIFKASLTASTGICFAQHLWLVLRRNAMRLATIEKLFILRGNLLALCDLGSTWRAPLLVLMALLVWCLGLATIYPPGALIVTFEAHTFTESHNMSVMNPPVPQHLNYAQDDKFPTLGNYNDPSGDDNLFLNIYDSPDANSGRRNFGYLGPSESLSNVAQSIIINNQVFSSVVFPGENSTYHLEFRGPQLRCSIVRRNISVPIDGTPFNDGLVFESKWDSKSLLYSIRQHRLGLGDPKQDLRNITSYVAESMQQSCEPVSVLYIVDLSSPRGLRKVDLSFSDTQPLLKKDQVFDGNDEVSLALPPEPQALQDWQQKVVTALPAVNEWALLDALGELLVGEYYNENYYYIQDGCQRGTNQTQDCVYFYMVGHNASYYTDGMLKGTVFHWTRFVRPDPWGGVYDPRDALDLTEAMLNDVLTNLTLSAISLGTWWDMVPVHTTRYQSTYSFANPLNLILPYSICLAAAILFAAIAIWSLWRNGIPAADGGFLQIMTATRGNTILERLVLKEEFVAIDNMSDELKSLKIRYGELVGEDVLGVEGRRLGFGTVEETVSLRKRRGDRRLLRRQ